MKKTFLLLSILFFACQQKTAKTDVDTQLRKSMSEFLYQSVHNDSSKVKFEIKELIFFGDKEFYECEFKVKMSHSGKDTTDIMKARIAKDFSKVVRMF